eukprot:SAG22_NODE_20025_length_269_cov_0.682353_1_plen_26_part_01
MNRVRPVSGTSEKPFVGPRVDSAGLV